MDEKPKPFRKSKTGVKAERRKKKKNDEEKPAATSEENAEKKKTVSLEEARRRNPKAFSIQNPVKAQQQFRR